MSETQDDGQEAPAPKRGKAYFNEAAAQLAKKNADAQKTGRAQRDENERKRLISIREAERRDVEAAIRSKEKPGR